MTRRLSLGIALAAFTLAGCSDSTAPVDTVPRQLYFMTCCASGYPYYPGYTRLFGAALDGSLPAQIIPDSVLAVQGIDPNFPLWISPDGSQIKVLARNSILTVDLFGSVLSVVPFPDSVPLSPLPALSPDGSQFAWFAHGSLILADVVGGGRTEVYFDSLGPVLEQVAWSRDGRSLAYVSWSPSQLTGAPQDIRVWTRRFSDGLARPIVTTAAVPGSLAWSRSGKWLSYAAGGDIHRLRTDASGTDQVVYNGSALGAASSSWGPGDSLLAIATGGSLLVIRPDGTGARTVTTGNAIWYSAWR